MNIDYQDASGTQFSSEVDRHPDTCPLCYRAVSVIGKNFVIAANGELEGIYRCANHRCRRLFIGRFYRKGYGSWFFQGVLPNNPRPAPTSPILDQISPEGIATYKEADLALRYGLRQVAGPGFRKALEFLVKDFVTVELEGEAKEERLRKPLAQCIREYVAEPKLQKIAERAAWLGNDETHYLRKWADKDLEDLVTLINAVMNWIVLQTEADQVLKDMPGGK